MRQPAISFASGSTGSAGYKGWDRQGYLARCGRPGPKTRRDYQNTIIGCETTRAENRARVINLFTKLSFDRKAFRDKVCSFDSGARVFVPRSMFRT